MTFSVTSKVMGQLIGSALEADSAIQKMVLDKVESLGKDLIIDLIRSTPLGAAITSSKTIMALLESGSNTDFKRGRDQWLNTLEPSSKSSGGGGALDKIKKAFENAASSESDRPENGHWKWSKSRNEWLNEDWRHDWRSQPRDRAGRWIEGRLNYTYVSRGKASKKVRSARRRAARRRIKWNSKTGMYE